METNNPLVSICIPVYDQVEYVKRLLDSILMQDYKSIEVVVSDDSPHNKIQTLCHQYTEKLSVRYYKHQPSLKTPKNWNFALDKALGDYIMLMHQDDYFAKMNSVSAYLNEFKKNKNLGFTFSRNTPMYDNGRFVEGVRRDKKIINHLKDKADYLVDIFVIGPPSNVMISKKIKTRYDERFIWLVDVDFCVRMIESGVEYSFIDEHLVTIGMHDQQATVFCHDNPEIMLRENVLYALKRPLTAFTKIFVFDYFWRLIRNYKVKSLEDLEKTGVKKEEINLPLRDIIAAQKNFSYQTLKNGFFSKILMFKSWFFNKHKYI
jgi:glycosyltransferase involved in cell wall biosynthesis